MTDNQLMWIFIKSLQNFSVKKKPLIKALTLSSVFQWCNDISHTVMWLNWYLILWITTALYYTFIFDAKVQKGISHSCATQPKYSWSSVWVWGYVPLSYRAWQITSWRKRKRKIFTGGDMEKKTSYTYYREALENNSWPKMKTKCWGMRKLETQKSWSW